MPSDPDPTRRAAEQSLEPVERARGPWLQLVSPRRFEWNVYELAIAGLPPSLAGLRIVHLSDVHVRPKWLAQYDELFDRLRGSSPDLIVLSGDIFEHQFNHRPALPFVERFLRGLSSRLGTFVILGNHDGDLVGPYITRFGATLFNGRFARIETRGAIFELLGLPSVARGDAEDGFLQSVPPRQPLVPRIAMAHYPDALDRLLAANLAPDIIVAGHTHGGQVCLPGGIPIIRHTPLPIRYTSGVHRFGRTWLVISRGFGFATYEVRLFCPAEVIELRLLPKE